MKTTEQTQSQRALCERAYGLFREFRGAYISEWQRLENCERMYCGDHWHDVPQTDRNEPRPITPILQSTIENLKAELHHRLHRQDSGGHQTGERRKRLLPRDGDGRRDRRYGNLRHAGDE